MEVVQVKKEDKAKPNRFKGMMVSYVRKNRGGHFSKGHKKGDKPIIAPIRQKKGIMMALPVDDNTVRIGWSLCNFSKEDEFGELGVNIARERAETASTVSPAQSMVDDLKKFIERAQAYYKDKKVEVTFPLVKKVGASRALGEKEAKLLKQIGK